RLEKGISLGSAMRESSMEFGPVFVSLVQAGEASGSLADNLRFLAEWLERDDNLRREISSVTLYPKLVVAATIILGGSVSILILPKLVPLFNSLHVQLPWVTVQILAFSIFLQHSWGWVLIGMIIFWILAKVVLRIGAVRYTLHRMYIHTPYVKYMIVDYQVALFSELMSTLLKSGLTIDESLDIAAIGTTNFYYRTIVYKVKERILKGISLAKTMSEYPDLYPINFVNVLTVGENGGSLDESFTQLSEFYTNEMKIKTQKLPTMIEPVLLVVIGLAVATLALSIILPIYKLTGNISGN
ncbi:MAG: type II secretion system F family protein, partial [Candidatus Paceibacterota bacterium]